MYPEGEPRFTMRGLHYDRRNGWEGLIKSRVRGQAKCLRNGEPLRRSFRYGFAGTNTGAPLSLTKNTTSFAGLALLALRLMT